MLNMFNLILSSRTMNPYVITDNYILTIKEHDRKELIKEAVKLLVTKGIYSETFIIYALDVRKITPVILRYVSGMELEYKTNNKVLYMSEYIEQVINDFIGN